MKKMLVLLLIGLISYTIFFDLTTGTLQKLHSEPSTPVHHDAIKFETMTVKEGDTVLSSLEKLNGTLPVTIEEALHDFKQLNPGVDPTMIQRNHSYKFPIYVDKKRPF